MGAGRFRKNRERVRGIEPPSPAWKAGALPLSYTRKALKVVPISFAVGARGFEPPTPCSQSRCATRLRHAPRRPGMSITKGDRSSNYGSGGDGLYLLVEETASQGGE